MNKKTCDACGKPIVGRAYNDGKKPIFGEVKGRMDVIGHKGTRWLCGKCKKFQDDINRRISPTLNKLFRKTK